MIAPECTITFARLPAINLDQIVAHMSDPRIADHLPLNTLEWDRKTAAEFVASKEAYWHRDALGHWAILCNGVYAGWGGYQREDGDWDFGLVLKPEYFGLGPRIVRSAIEFARADERIPFVTFLLPLSRIRRRGLARLGAELVGEVRYAGNRFLKYRVETL